MARYATEQKKILVDFLRESCDTAYSVEEISERVPLAKSTVYRLMTRLVEDGAVKRMTRGNSRTFVYQMIAGEHCRSHLHLKCITCGKVIHMGERVSDELLDAIKKSNDFSVSEKETVILGKCSVCGEKQGE